MADEMNIADYLAQGGVLTAPGNAPPRYRAELMRMMASFVDSELAGAAGFADIINLGPGVTERIAAARIVMEKTDHAGQILRLMGEFGADIQRYATYHPWTDRLPRDAPVGTERASPDMRLSVFNYPLDGWADAVVMNLLMGKAVDVQLAEYTMMSYQPMADAVRRIAPVEAHHTVLATEGLTRLIANGEKGRIQTSIAYWWPRVAVSFGGDTSKRADALRAMGLRHADNATLRARWWAEAESALASLGMTAPTN